MRLNRFNVGWRKYGSGSGGDGSFGSPYKVPTELRLRKALRRLDVTFGDGITHELPAELLRVYSPSAEVFGHDGSWSIPPRRKGVSLLAMEPVGNYAVRLIFDDRHDTGIYPYSLLHELSINKLSKMREYVRKLRQSGLSRHPLTRRKKQ